jgi:hypothetical protein
MLATTIVSLVCWIMVLIKIFKQNVGLGILGIICGLFTFIYGWVKVKEFECKNVMVAWTIAIVVAIIAQVLGGAVMFQMIMQQASQGA